MLSIMLVVSVIAVVAAYAEGSRREAAAFLEIANEELKRLAVTDRLTGLFNRQKLDDVLGDEAARCQRGSRPFSLLMIDLDHFKSVNDRCGHLVGDEVLVRLAQVLRASCRKIDIVGRWGGEEFLVVCPQTDLDEAAALANRVLNAICGTTHEKAGALAASIGVSTWREGDTSETALLRADEALYRAKAEGRRRVEVACP